MHGRAERKSPQFQKRDHLYWSRCNRIWWDWHLHYQWVCRLWQISTWVKDHGSYHRKWDRRSTFRWWYGNCDRRADAILCNHGWTVCRPRIYHNKGWKIPGRRCDQAAWRKDRSCRKDGQRYVKDRWCCDIRSWGKETLPDKKKPQCDPFITKSTAWSLRYPCRTAWFLCRW